MELRGNYENEVGRARDRPVTGGRPPLLPRPIRDDIRLLYAMIYACYTPAIRFYTRYGKL